MSIQPERLADFEALCPGIVHNPYVPHWPTPKQIEGLTAHLIPGNNVQAGLLYGGAAGGGKSDWLLMAAAQYVDRPDFAALLLRKTHTDLAQPGALMDRALQWWSGKARWDAQNKIFHFPSGAKVAFAYLAGPRDHYRYQSAEYQLIGIDELTQWDSDIQFTYLLSRLRRPAGSRIPLRALVCSNPGDVGHTWVKARFIGGVSPDTGEFVDPICRYIPARIEDNPHIDREAYIEQLKHLHPTLREQLLNGDWDAREPGDYYRVEWFGPFLDAETDHIEPKDKISVRWWDLAASEAEDAAYTSGVLMSRFRKGLRAIEHAVSFRATPGARDSRIVQTAKADGHHVYVGIEIEPGSGGLAQFLALERVLQAQGFRVVGARPKAELHGKEDVFVTRAPTSDTAKEKRSGAVASCLHRGFESRAEGGNPASPWWGKDDGKMLHHAQEGLRIYAGPWTHAYLDRVCGFPDTGKDEADATAGAWFFLEAHPFGLQDPPQRPKAHDRAMEAQDVHPADRPEPKDLGRTRSGHWRP